MLDTLRQIVGPEHVLLNRSPAELAAFRALKIALDPRGILNPRALLPEPH